MPIAPLAYPLLVGATLLLGCAAPVAPPRTATPQPAVTAPPASSPVASLLSTEIVPTPTSPPAAELSAAPAPTPTEGPSLSSLTPLTAETAMDQVVERAPLPPEARVLARTLRPTMTAEHDEGAGLWEVDAGRLGHWRVYDTTWVVEPADGVAQLWQIQSRLDLR